MGPSSGSSLVLVVDDFPESVDPLMAMLHERGCIVSLALDGGSALAKASSLKPDVIVMDFAMPQLDGIEATRRLKASAHTCDIPVILFSAHAGPELGNAAERAGCAAVFKKPRATVDVVERVLALCAQPELTLSSR